MEIQLISQNNEEMHRRLEKASLAGDVDELHRILQEDNLLLHHLNSLYPMNSPLHIASAVGHADFVKEILARKPEYAVEFNTHGLTALHLACANGHLSVVRELVHLRKKLGVEICEVRDKDGFLPIHTAALRGNVQILEELLGSCSHVAVRGLTCLGDSILHLAVKSNCFEAVKFLVEKMKSDHEFFNLRDAKGNTILHLAIVRKQLQTVKFLLGKEWTDANAKNNKGCTTLDVLLESPSEPGDLLLGEILRAAGGAATETSQLVQNLPSTEQTAAPNNNPSPCINWESIRHRFFGSSPERPDKYTRETRSTLMVVNTLIATVTFQEGLNPPGGFAQFDDKGKKLGWWSMKILPGQALITNDLVGSGFLFCDIVALLFSLSVILLIICGGPQLKCMITTSIIMTWIAVFFTGWAFFTAIPSIFPNASAWVIMSFFFTWNSIIIAFAWYNLTRFHVSKYRNISQYIINKRTRRDGRTRCFFLFATHLSLLRFVKVCMVVSCIASCGTSAFLIFIILHALSFWLPY